MTNDAWVNRLTRPASVGVTAEGEVVDSSSDGLSTSVAKKPAASRSTAKKPAASRSTAKKPAASRSTSAAKKPVEPPVSTEPTEEELEAERRRRRAQVSRRGPAKRAATYRLEEEVLDMVDAAVVDAIDKGKRLTKDAAVAYAIRKAYGKLL